MSLMPSRGFQDPSASSRLRPPMKAISSAAAAVLDLPPQWLRRVRQRHFARRAAPCSMAIIRKVDPMPRGPSRRRSRTAASSDDDYVFVGTERGSFVAVYKLDQFGQPHFEQLLPGPLGPEGLLAIPHRNLVIASGETDLEGFAVRST